MRQVTGFLSSHIIAFYEVLTHIFVIEWPYGEDLCPEPLCRGRGHASGGCGGGGIADALDVQLSTASRRR